MYANLFRKLSNWERKGNFKGYGMLIIIANNQPSFKIY